MRRFLLLIVFLCTASAAAETPRVRVMLEQNVGGVFLLAQGGGEAPILSGVGGGPVRLNLPAEPVQLRLTSAGWTLGNQSFPRGEIVLTQVAGPGSVEVAGGRYRGRFRFRPGGETRFDVLNDLDLEGYLNGVLPGELPPGWHAETFKAQAVIARTYAIWEIKTAGPGRGYFDVYDDDRSQVYRGLDAEHDTAREAVAATRGQVAVHRTDKGWRIFKAYFHSTSGGVTLGNDAAFGEPAVGPLSAQDLGDAGKASSRFQWEPIVLDKKEVTRRVKLWGKRRGHSVRHVGDVDRLEVAETNRFGRPTRFELIDRRGNKYSLVPEEVRWALNTDRGDGPPVYSGFFTPINNRTNIVLADGRGWGHGVGMCQWTAEAWAEAGKRHAKIVTDSYPGTRVTRAY